MKKTTQYELGITILEASLSSVLIIMLLMMTAGIWQYLEASFGISSIVESYASRSISGIYSYNQKNHEFEVNFDKVKKHFSEALVEKAVNELQQEVLEKTSNNLKIEFIFTTVKVNPTTGEVILGGYSDQNSLIIEGGKASIPNFLEDKNISNGEANFQLSINNYIQKHSKDLAIPTYAYGLLDSSQKYLPDVPILAVRAIYNLGSSFLLHRLGFIDNSYVWEIKVASLRGDV